MYLSKVDFFIDGHRPPSKKITLVIRQNIVIMKYFFLSCLLANAFLQVNSQSSKIPTIAMADSFYYDRNWSQAARTYELVLHDTSSNPVPWSRLGFSYYNSGNNTGAMKAYQKSAQLNPSTLLKPVLYSRIARSFAKEKKYDEAVNALNVAVEAGYANADELDSLPEFDPIRSKEKFTELIRKIFAAAYPCSTEPKSMEFDFWIGEWIVYVTGTHFLAGHSKIQRASGGCMILENWTSANNSYNGKSINFFDPEIGKWEQIWVGSEGGPSRVHRFFNGEYRDSAMRFESKGKNAKGEDLIGRFTFYNQGAGQVRQLKESSTDGIKWSVDYDFTYFRVK